MQRYRVLERDICDDDSDFQALVAKAYLSKSSALRLCRSDMTLKLYLSLRQGTALNLPEPAHGDALGLLFKTPGVDHHVWRPG